MSPIGSIRNPDSVGVKNTLHFAHNFKLYDLLKSQGDISVCTNKQTNKQMPVKLYIYVKDGIWLRRNRIYEAFVKIKWSIIEQDFHTSPFKKGPTLHIPMAQQI